MRGDENEKAGSGLAHPNRPTRSKTACKPHSSASSDPNSSPVLVDRDLAVGRLGRWATRGAA